MNGRRYTIEMGTGLVAYGALLVVSLLLLQRGTLPAGLRVAIAIMPMLPALGICWAIIRQIARIDEFQRRLQLEALSIAFAGTAFITFGYGFLENAGYPRLSMFAVWPVMAILWVAGLLVCRRRYA